MEESPESGPEPNEEVGSSALRTFVGLFFVPLLVVGLCVAVFVGFGWIAYDKHSTRDYLNDLRSGWRPHRAQAAYELSKILVADPEALADTPEAAEELRQLFREADEGDMKRYLALVLGYTKDVEAIPLLTEAAESADSETRIYALWALGTLGHASSLSILTTALTDPDPGVRKTAAFALGELGQPQAGASLEPLLADSIADVRWNAALSLSRLGSTAGIPVLLEMVDRDLNAQAPGITPAQAEEAMVSAVLALGASGAAESRSILEELAESDPSLKVRQAALQALQALES